MMHTSHKPKSRGFTMLEIVIVVGISIAVILALIPLYSGYIRTYTYATAVGTTAGSATATANELQKWVLQADKIATNTTISGTLYTTGTGTLVLEIPAIDVTGSAIANMYDYVVFYSSGTNLYRTLSPNAASSRVAGSKTLSTTLQTLTFTYNNSTLSAADAITVDMTMSKVAGHQTTQYHMTQKLYLRN